MASFTNRPVVGEGQSECLSPRRRRGRRDALALPGLPWGLLPEDVFGWGWKGNWLSFVSDHDLTGPWSCHFLYSPSDPNGRPSRFSSHRKGAG